MFRVKQADFPIQYIPLANQTIPLRDHKSSNLNFLNYHKSKADMIDMEVDGKVGEMTNIV